MKNLCPTQSTSGDNQSADDIIDQVTSMKMTGDTIPQLWFKTMPRRGKDCSVRLLLKILILGHICALYRWRVVLVEGKQIKRKKFQGEFLQLVISELATLYGCSVDVVYRAVNDLEEDQLIAVERADDGRSFVVPMVKNITTLSPIASTANGDSCQ